MVYQRFKCLFSFPISSFSLSSHIFVCVSFFFVRLFHKLFRIGFLYYILLGNVRFRVLPVLLDCALNHEISKFYE